MFQHLRNCYPLVLTGTALKKAGALGCGVHRMVGVQKSTQ